MPRKASPKAPGIRVLENLGATYLDDNQYISLVKGVELVVISMKATPNSNGNTDFVCLDAAGRKLSIQFCPAYSFVVINDPSVPKKDAEMKKPQRMQVLASLSASYNDNGQYLTLAEGTEWAIKSMKTRRGSVDFVCADSLGREFTAQGCPDYTFAVIDADTPPAQPVFKKIKAKVSLAGTDIAARRTVSIPTNSVLNVQAVMPNNADYAKNFAFTCTNSKGVQLRVTNVPRMSFSVMDGDGVSLWDDVPIGHQ